MNPIMEQGAEKLQKLEGSRETCKNGAGSMIKIKKGAGRWDPLPKRGAVMHPVSYWRRGSRQAF